MVVFFGLAMGMSQAREFEDEQIIWTPAGNPSLESRDKAKELFPTEEKFRAISLILESENGNVITKANLQKLIDMEEILHSTWEYSDTTLDATN
jgi:hypothetical protein